MAEENSLFFPSPSLLVPPGAQLKPEDSKDPKEAVAIEGREMREKK